MPRDFLPRREADLLAWAENFAGRIAADAGAYGLTPAQAAAFEARRSAFAAAYAVATTPGSRTRPAVAAKDAARAALEAEARALAAVVRAGPGVSDAQRVGLGLRPRGAGRARIGRPGDRPTVRVAEVVGRRIRVVLSEAGAPGRGKPRGVAGAAVLYHVGESAPTDAAEWSFGLQTTRAEAELAVGPAAEAGARVWVTARWFNPRGELGPWAEAVWACVQRGVAATAGGRRAAA